MNRWIIPKENDVREEYDFSNGERNPYPKREKSTITIRLDRKTVEYFKAISDEVNMPYQTIINAYLTDCAKKQKKPVLSWD